MKSAIIANPIYILFTFENISEIEIFSSTNLFLNKLENIFWKYLRQKLRYAIIQQFPSLAIYPRFNAKVSRDGIEISPCYSARLFHSSCFISACAKIIQLRVNFPIETSPLLSPPRVQNFKLSPIEIDRTSWSDVGSFSSRKCIYSKVYICLSTDLDHMYEFFENFRIYNVEFSILIRIEWKKNESDYYSDNYFVSEIDEMKFEINGGVSKYFRRITRLV